MYILTNFLWRFFCPCAQLELVCKEKKLCANYNRVTQKRILHFNILARGKEADEHATQLAYLIYFANVIVHFFWVLIFKYSNELYICSIEPCISIFINFLAIFPSAPSIWTLTTEIYQTTWNRRNILKLFYSVAKLHNYL